MALVLKQEQIEQSTEQHLDSACRSNDIEVIELLEHSEVVTMSETAMTIEAVTVDLLIDERIVPRVNTDDGLIVKTGERPVKVNDLTRMEELYSSEESPVKSKVQVETRKTQRPMIPAPIKPKSGGKITRPKIQNHVLSIKDQTQRVTKSQSRVPEKDLIE